MKHIVFLLCGISPCLVMAVPAEPFFLPERIAQIEMSPDGQIVLLEVNENDATYIEAVIPASRKSFVLRSVGNSEISTFIWLGNETFLFKMFVEEAGTWHYVTVHLTVKNGEIRDSEFRLLDSEGSLVDELPEDDKYMLFFFKSRVYRYPLQTRGEPMRHLRDRNLVEKVPLPAYGVVLTDAAHTVRFMVGEEVPDEPVDPAATENQDIDSPEAGLPQPKFHPFWYRSKGDSTWKFSARMDAKYWYVPVGYATNQNDVVMISDHDRDTRAVMVFRPETGEFIETLFEMEGIDIQRASLSHSGELQSVHYVQDGRLEQKHFLKASETDMAALREAVGEQDNEIFLVDSSMDGRWHLAKVYGATESGRYLYFDTKTREALDLGSKSPWLKGLTTSNIRVIETMNAAGLRLEGYLVLPSDLGSAERFPLVVMPHGGPMGIQATSGFDAGAQFLAANGLAVLKVNYRGSGGFGRAFKDSGKGEYGRGIEDDIEALVDAAIAGQPIDPNRICAYGSSYGGYSSLMLGLRNPDRYRCSAAFAAPTDTQLLFTASDWMHDDDLVEIAQQWYGDPKKDAELMHARSPAYLANTFSTPLLIAHGLEDYRVDIEHYHRLTSMLDRFDKDYEGIVLPEAGHGFPDSATKSEFYDRLRGFLVEHTAARVLAEAR